jgi:hypothetical protein
MVATAPRLHPGWGSVSLRRSEQLLSSAVRLNFEAIVTDKIKRVWALTGGVEAGGAARPLPERGATVLLEV